ncbi:arylformamidase [Trypanosoma conorhini]|uniref:Arylformamidase n=1 Tax=Trypanosoma conorhini TaxID=83891 RepID=A0A422Q1B2_9TRYP|nr:arylformamidase [Trypanosoma conorhini]RNF23804.1 arylformamidase [Trypanosoma conorhini]
MSSEGKRKFAEWHHPASSAATVRLDHCVDLSAHAGAARGTAPGVAPFYLLENRSFLADRMRLPSLAVTSFVSFVFGVAWTLSQLSRRAAGGARPVSLLRLLLGAVLLVAYMRFLRWRQSMMDDVIRCSNFSRLLLTASRLGGNALAASNPQLWLHGDTPFTLLRNGGAELFGTSHYTGDAVIVDISDLLEADCKVIDAGTPLPITRRVLEAAVVPDAATSPVWRLLLVTSRLRNRGEGTWARGFACMEVDAVRCLAELYPSLLLIGTDALIVDDPATPPVTDSTRDALDECGIAVLEGLHFAGIYPRLKASRFIKGSMMTLFEETQSLDDVRGCRVVFFPSAA